MPLSLNELGRTETQEYSYTSRDVILYALGIGALEDELKYLYEGADKKGPSVFPTFAAVPSFPAIESLFQKLGGNLQGLVHASQAMRFHAPFMHTDTVHTEAKVVEMYDLKRMAQVVLTAQMRSRAGVLLAEADMTLFFRFDGNFGGEPPPKRETIKTPDRPADWTFEQTIAREQALLYRLNGDLNPLHADPQFAKQAGFDRPILHGLCTYGFVARAVVKNAAGGDGARLKSLSGQFRNPVLPGETLRVEGWKEASASNAERHILRASVVSEAGATVVFDRATAEL